MNDVLKKVSDTVTNDPVFISVDIKPDKWWKFKPKQKTFAVTQITLGNLIRISKRLTGIDKNVFDEKDLLQSNYQAMEKYGRVLAEIVAIAMHNKKDMPGNGMIEMVESNFTAKDLFKVLSVIIRQMDVTSFMSTIISIRGISILESQDANAKSAKEVSL